MKEKRRVKIVFLGGGHANTLALLGISKRPDVEITLVSDGDYSFYSGMVPGLIAGQYTLDQVRINLNYLSDKYKFTFIPHKAVSINSIDKFIILENDYKLDYDILALNIGSKSNDLRIPGINEFSIATRPLRGLISCIGEIKTSRCAIVIGGGIAGIELAFALRVKFPSSLVLLIQRHKIVPEFNSKIRKVVKRELIGQHIEIIRSEVVQVTENCVVLEDMRSIHCDIIVCATGARAIPLEADIQKCSNGYFLTNRFLQSVSSPFIFAAGDCITIEGFDNFPPKAGVYAVKEAQILIENLQKTVDMMQGRIATQLSEYVPQRDFLKIINMCNGRAIGIKWGKSYEGILAWKLKNTIDTSFMKQFA